MSHEEWLLGGVTAFALGLFVAGKIFLQKGDFSMTSWDYRLTAPEGEQMDDEQPPQEHLDREAWIAEHEVEWWAALAEQVEQEWFDAPDSEERWELRAPKAARNAS